MGNNYSLTQFYAPPSPPTPLSPEKYFWIKSSEGHKQNGEGSLDANSSSETASSQKEFARDIPVVYITPSRTKTSSSRSSAYGDEDEDEEDSTRCTLLYCHGHDVDLGLIYPLLVHMSNLLGVDILSFDYAGYGLSKIGKLLLLDTTKDQEESNSLGELTEQSSSSNNASQIPQAQLELPSEEQCNADILACFNYLVEQRGILPQNIILYGKSLGSGPVCWLAHKLCHEATSVTKKKEMNDELNEDRSKEIMVHSISKDEPIKLRRTVTPVPDSFRRSPRASAATPKSPPPLGGIVLHSAFLSILRLKVGFTISSVGDPFDNIQRLEDMHNSASASSSSPDSVDGPGYNLPIYLIHGKDDTVVPFNHGEILCSMVMEKRKKGFPPFWADGGTHGNIEHKYATAYIKRLQQFFRHCNKVNNGIVSNKDKPRGRSRSISRANRSPNINDNAGRNNIAQQQGGDLGPIQITQYYLPNGVQDSNFVNIQEQDQINIINEANGRRGRGERTRRPSNTALIHHRARSSGRARQRKKKGTLVMRGVHEEEEETLAESKCGTRGGRGRSGTGYAPRVPRMTGESRNPLPSTARMI